MNHGFSDDDDLEYCWGEMAGFTRKLLVDSGEGVGKVVLTGCVLVYQHVHETKPIDTTPLCSSSDIANLQSTTASSASSSQYNTAF